MHWYLVVVSHRLRNENVISVTSNSDKHIQSNTSLSVALATHVTHVKKFFHFGNFWKLPGCVLHSAKLHRVLIYNA